MKIKLIRPIFKCQHDELIFFQRLSLVTGFEGILERGDTFELTVSDINVQHTINEVKAICDIWNGGLMED